MDLEHLKYPIGKFKFPENPNAEYLTSNLMVLQELPQKLRDALKGMDIEQLQRTYRPGGWSMIQLLNHLADSHMNAFIRFKLGLTEDNPTIRPYKEELWATTFDGMEMNYDHSLKILEGLHARWVNLILKLSKEDFQRTIFHPESKRQITLLELVGTYAWHSNHHLAHIELCKINKSF